MSSSRHVSIGVTISSLVVGLLLLTVAGSVGIALVIRDRIVVATAETLQREITTRIGDKVQEQFGPLGGILREYRATAEAGLLPVDEGETLAALLSERVRHDPRLEWLAFARSDGNAVTAVQMPDGTVSSLYLSPGDPVELEMRHQDGTRELPDIGEMALSPLELVAWFELGAASEEPTWTPAYRRPIDGKRGRACVLSLRRDGELVGVFGLGFGVEFLRDYASGLRVGQSGRVFSLDPTNGEIVLSPSPQDLELMGPAVTSAVAALPGGTPELRPGELHTISVTHDGVRYLVGMELQQRDGMPRWMPAIVIPERELVGYLSGYLPVGLAAVGALLLASIALAQLLAGRIARPLRSIAEDLERVGDFELSEQRSPTSLIREVAVVGSSVDRMKASLRSFARYVPTDLVRELLREGVEARLDGVERPLTLFFSDVEGFTGSSEGMAPTALVDALGDYLEVVTQVVHAQHGTIDKFIGDGVLAFFNAPEGDPDHVAHGCQAALDLQTRLDGCVPRWQADGRPSFRTRVGLHCDRVVVGNIGTPERFAYTVIGDGVNLASRLEALNKVYGTRILASDAVRAAAGQRFVWRRVDRTAVAGRAAGVDVFELLGTADTVEASRIEARDSYETALEAYLDQRFEQAVRGFATAARLQPGDRAAKLLRARAELYALTPPPQDWDGVFVQTGK